MLVGDADPEVRRQLVMHLSPLRPSVYEADSGTRLDELLKSGPFDLVVASAQLPMVTGLSVLARARSRGDKTPFIVVTSHHALVLRVMVSDDSGTVLSSRVVDGENLATLAKNLVERRR